MNLKNRILILPLIVLFTCQLVACSTSSSDKTIDSENTSTLVGTVEDISATTWTIDDKIVQVGDDVLIKGNILIGDQVEALVTLGENASLHAIEIEFVSHSTSVDANETNHLEDEVTEVIEFYGTVESISSENWTINGKIVSITPTTDIKGNNHLGKMVWVQAYPQENDSYIAIQIRPTD